MKRAHDYSGIGQVSNGLTRLWNREDPDRVAAAWLTYYNNLVIDGAKTGSINSYENYPKVHQRILQAIGGQNGRMPFFFQFSRNGRKALKERNGKKKTFAPVNHSTMNRLCACFSHLKRTSFSGLGLHPFNWQMLLTEPPNGHIPEAVELFTEMDEGNLCNVLEARELNDIGEKSQAEGYDALAEMIETELCARWSSLEAVYPSIVRYLFAGENMKRSAHKQMFWRVFGKLAVDAIEHNVPEAKQCPHCNAMIPLWAGGHQCDSTTGFLECIECGRWCERTSPKQVRCPECQKEFTRRNVNRLHSKYARQRRGKDDHVWDTCLAL